MSSVPTAVITATRPPLRRSRIGLAVVAFFALGITISSIVLYSQGSLAVLAEQNAGLASTYADAPLGVQIAFYLHITTGSLALAIGPFQFIRRFRNRAPRAHRAIGRVYLTAVAVAALNALIMAPFGFSGMVGFFGFSTLAVLWLVTGWRALHAIRSGDQRTHQAWMIRNYALTFAAPTLRLWLLLLGLQLLVIGDGADIDAAFANAYAAVPFLCWLPNLIVAEWLIRRRGLPSYRLVDPAGQ